MSYDAPLTGEDLGYEVPPRPPDADVDVPTQLDVLPDGRESLVIGDVQDLAEFNHQQGDNPYGFTGTCGLCSCESVLDQFGVDVTEAEMVEHAVDNGQCTISDDPAKSGGSTPQMQADILNDYGVPAHVEQGESLEDLAADVEQGRGVIIEGNAGVLWNDQTYYEYGQVNHAVVVTGVARDPQTGELQGFFINDSGSGASGQFVDASTMSSAWLDAGGACVVTDAARPSGGEPDTLERSTS